MKQTQATAERALRRALGILVAAGLTIGLFPALGVSAAQADPITHGPLSVTVDNQT
jgi:hypothetical protein